MNKEWVLNRVTAFTGYVGACNWRLGYRLTSVLDCCSVEPFRWRICNFSTDWSANLQKICDTITRARACFYTPAAPARAGKDNDVMQVTFCLACWPLNVGRTWLIQWCLHYSWEQFHCLEYNGSKLEVSAWNLASQHSRSLANPPPTVRENVNTTIVLLLYKIIYWINKTNFNYQYPWQHIPSIEISTYTYAAYVPTPSLYTVAIYHLVVNNNVAILSNAKQSNS